MGIPSETGGKPARTITPRGFDRSAQLLKTLAHPHRLRMLELLLGQRYTVGELAEACGLPSHMASEHLRLMQRSGMLSREKQGRCVYYRVAQPRVANSVMACVQAGAEPGGK